jgi:hypothetical protein
MHLTAGITVALVILVLFFLGGFIWQAIDVEEFPDAPGWCRPKWLCQLLGIPHRASPHGE